MAVHAEGSVTVLRTRRAVLIRRVRLQAARARARLDVRIAPDAILGTGIVVRCDPGTSNTLEIGPQARVRNGVRIHLHGGTVRIGPYCDVRDNTMLNVGGTFEMDTASALSWDTTVHCDGHVRFEEWAATSDGVALVDSTHYHSAPEVPFHANLKTGSISVGRHAWIGTRAVVLRNTTIGDYCTVGAGAVVSGEVPAGHLAIGNPAVVQPRRSPLPWLSEETP